VFITIDSDGDDILRILSVLEQSASFPKLSSAREVSSEILAHANCKYSFSGSLLEQKRRGEISNLRSIPIIIIHL
jgi:hypothetical protein